MQKSQKRLGRGLSSLISVPADTQSSETGSSMSMEASTPTLSAHPSQIQPNARQPRREMDEVELKALADSIRQSGMIQPIIVRATGPERYEIIAGERRWRAAQLAGLDEVPVLVRDASDEQMLELALVENIFREDLNAIDRAEAYRHYCQEFDLSPDEVAERLGEDRSTVTNYIRLLDLPDEVKSWVSQGKLAMGHARCLLAVKSSVELTKLAKRAMNLGMSVRALEGMVRSHVEGRQPTSSPARIKAEKRPQIKTLEEAFIRSLGVKVEIQESARKGSGKIVIHYHNLDDFDRVVDALRIET